MVSLERYPSIPFPRLTSYSSCAHRYPLALASIHMTAFTLDLAEKRDLQLLLLRTTQTKPEPSSTATEYTALMRISSDLLLLFHEHWKRGSFTVMRELCHSPFCPFMRPDTSCLEQSLNKSRKTSGRP